MVFDTWMFLCVSLLGFMLLFSDGSSMKNEDFDNYNQSYPSVIRQNLMLDLAQFIWHHQASLPGFQYMTLVFRMIRGGVFGDEPSIEICEIQSFLGFVNFLYMSLQNFIHLQSKTWTKWSVPVTNHMKIKMTLSYILPKYYEHRINTTNVLVWLWIYFISMQLLFSRCSAVRIVISCKLRGVISCNLSTLVSNCFLHSILCIH